jgi:hypothetical protein
MLRILPPLLFVAGTLVAGEAAAERRLPIAEYRDKLKAGWACQMAGVSWGRPTEFRFNDQIIPEDRVPTWEPGRINNGFGEDDIYVEMTFLRTLEQHGIDAPIRQAGLDFANSGYMLWCANAAGRTNLRNGIAPPDSGHPQFNRCPNDIDYQIEADYSGLIAPGLPQVAVDMGERFGRLMNYGDGVYAGQFIGAMYAEAYFESDPRRIATTALSAIPAESVYAQMVRDLLDWSQAEADWQATWRRAMAKYRHDPEFTKDSNGAIDCRINGAWVLMGLLYGKGELPATIVTAMRGGHDSDCNPASAAGVLGCTLGFTKLPPAFQDINGAGTFSHSAYTFDRLLEVCEQLTRALVVRHGGRIEQDAQGGEVLVIPVRAARPSAHQPSWAPGPVTNERFTAEEMTTLAGVSAPPQVREAMQTFAPGWVADHCGNELDPGLRENHQGRSPVLATHPESQDTPCVLSRTVDIPAGRRTHLRLAVGHHEMGDWTLVVRADMQELLRREVGKDTVTDGWLEVQVDLSSFAGRRVMLELFNQASGWRWEGAFWTAPTIVSE